MTPSLEGWPTKAKEAPSPHEVRLALLDTNVTATLEVFYIKVFFKILQNSKESTCVGVSCVGDTNNRIESVIHVNFLHSNFARFPENFYCKTFIWEKYNMEPRISK